ncbi:MAG: lipoyl(octanoyl) transferase LipB [Alphaproteobacteria bacterium]|nr:lipoyl(octanoyl) transferase LipB [Alphaproteobacteria bacterium]
MAVAQKKPAASKPAASKTSAPKKTVQKTSVQKIPVHWQSEERPVPYDRALAFMEAKVAMIREKGEADTVWLLEHPPVYTAGTSADPKDLLNARFPVYSAGRGGQYTYHGPGQRVAYVMTDLQRRSAAGAGPDLRVYIHDLEEWIIQTLSTFDVKGERRSDRVGIWVDMKPYGKPKGTEAKIAAIGVRVRKWVAFHGVSVNINPDLSHFDGIVPCGISQHGVTSLAALGIKVTMQEFDAALKENWHKVFA